MKVLFMFIALVTLMRPMGVFADSEIVDMDYSVITPNNEFVFVMFVPDEEIELRVESANNSKHLRSTNYTSILDFLRREGLGTNKELRTKYPCSGLYKNDGSSKPIWTVNWYAPQVFIHPDGEYLVRMGRWPRLKFDDNGHRLYDELAIAFYRNGNQLEKYVVQDLVSNPEVLPVSISHYGWRKDTSFDETKGILRVGTHTGETYEFNVFEMSPENNSKVSSCKPNELYKYTQELRRTLLILAPIPLTAAILLIRRMIKNKKP